MQAESLVVDSAGLVTLNGKGYLEGPGSNLAKCGAGHGGIGGKGLASGKKSGFLLSGKYLMSTINNENILVWIAMWSGKTCHMSQNVKLKNKEN